MMGRKEQTKENEGERKGTSTCLSIGEDQRGKGRDGRK